MAPQRGMRPQVALARAHGPPSSQHLDGLQMGLSWPNGQVVPKGLQKRHLDLWGADLGSESLLKEGFIILPSMVSGTPSAALLAGQNAPFMFFY